MLSPGAMSCLLTYCGDSLIWCKTVIRNDLLFLEKWEEERGFRKEQRVTRPIAAVRT